MAKGDSIINVNAAANAAKAADKGESKAPVFPFSLVRFALPPKAQQTYTDEKTNVRRRKVGFAILRQIDGTQFSCNVTLVAQPDTKTAAGIVSGAQSIVVSYPGRYSGPNAPPTAMFDYVDDGAAVHGAFRDKLSDQFQDWLTEQATRPEQAAARSNPTGVAARAGLFSL
jgi:hypothetical protein